MGATTTLSAESLLRRLEWRVVRRLDGRLQGDYRTLFRGAGLDFTDLREYVPGDDLRHIEWNVTARLDEPYVRQFVEDRELTAWLLLDPPASGRNQVLRIAKTLLDRREARAAALEPTPPGRRRGSRRGETAGGAPPGVRRVSVRRGRVRGPTPSGAVTDLGALLATAYGVARRRSLVIVVSDFITTDGWEAPLSRLARRHEVVAIQVIDPRESELPDAGGVYVEDAETGEQIFVDTSDVGFRARLAAAAEVSGVSLTWPWALAGLLVVPLLVVAYRRTLRTTEARRQELAAQGLVL